MTRRISFVLVGAALALATVSVSAAAQATGQRQQSVRFLLASNGAPPVALDVGRTPALRQRLTLDLEGVTVREALTAISERARLVLWYTDDVIVADRRVNLRADEITVAAALTDVLVDAGVDVVFNRDGTAVIVKRVASVAFVQVGAISGRVTESTSGDGVEGATVTVGGTRLSTTTSSDGRYTIRTVPIGTRVVTAAKIGFSRQARSVTVTDNETVTADFVLVRAPTMLGQVVVTGTIVPTEVKALPTPVSVITAEDLQRHHIRRFEDAIRLAVPGAVVFDQATHPAGLTQIALRGTSGLYASSHPKVYIDGVEVTGHATSPMDPQSIERIEVVRGPQAAAIYGSDAMGGVIQVFTKRGTAELGRPELEARVAFGRIESAFEGSGALRQEYGASLNGRSGPASYRVGGGYMRTGDWVPGFGISNPSLYGSARLEHGPFTVDFSGRHFQQTIDGMNSPAVVEAAPAFFQSGPRYAPTQTKQETYAVRMEYRTNSRWQHSLTLGNDRFGMSQVQTRDRLTTPADTFRTVNFQGGSKASAAYHATVRAALGPGITANLTAGADHYASNRQLTLAFRALTTSGQIQFVPGTAILTRSEATNTGAFGQVQVNVREALFFTGAVRGEWNSNFGDDLGVPISPRVGLSYLHQLGGATVKLRGAYGEAIRPPFPGNKEENVTPYSRQLANPSLKPERTSGPDGGIDLFFGQRASLRITYYRQLAKDLIDVVTIDATSSPQVIQRQNVSRVRNTGWEFEGSAQLGLVTLKSQWAITESLAEELGPSYTGDVKEGEQMFSVPRHTGALSVMTTPLRGMSVAAALAYTGEWRDYDFLAFYRCLADTGPCNGFELGGYLTDYPGFTMVNLSLEKELRRGVTAYLGVEDLTDTSDRARAGNNAIAIPGRTTTLGLRVRY